MDKPVCIGDERNACRVGQLFALQLVRIVNIIGFTPNLDLAKRRSRIENRNIIPNRLTLYLKLTQHNLRLVWAERINIPPP